MGAQHAQRDVAQVGAAGDLRRAQEAQHREPGRVRRRAVVVGARALRERLAVGGCEEQVAFALVVEAADDRARERDRAREEALTRTRAVQIEARLEQRRVVVEEREHVRAALVPDPQQAPVGVDEPLGEEVGRRGRVGEHRRVLEQRARASEPGDAQRVPRRDALVVGAGRDARAARGEQLSALACQVRARLARAIHQHGGAVLEVAALGHRVGVAELFGRAAELGAHRCGRPHVEESLFTLAVRVLTRIPAAVGRAQLAVQEHRGLAHGP